MSINVLKVNVLIVQRANIQKIYIIAQNSCSYFGDLTVERTIGLNSLIAQISQISQIGLIRLIALIGHNWLMSFY